MSIRVGCGALPVNVLLSSAGRRVELLNCIRADLQALGYDGMVLATDADGSAPAGLLADRFETIPKVDEPEYLSQLKDIVDRHNVELVIPTIDTELDLLSEQREAFAVEGVVVLVSGPETVRIAGDKQFTHEFFSRCGLACPQQWPGNLARDRAADLPYPVVVKPRRGSLSVGVEVVSDPQVLRLRANDQNVVQTLAPGTEYTVDVFVDRTGEVRSVAPRRRIATRGGEVSKGTLERCLEIEELARQIADALPDAFGPLTVQIFRDAQRGCQAIEINARFGGGYPLSWQAGARTTRWAIQEAEGVPWEPHDLSWTPGLTMLRYDQSVFVQGVTA